MAKSLYSALFDWIVLRINHALLNKKDMEEAVSVRMPAPPLSQDGLPSCNHVPLLSCDPALPSNLSAVLCPLNLGSALSGCPPSGHASMLCPCPCALPFP